mmetsp:Transcript_30377/g.29857  ORF Transcript_30377/g.29857 Transcript_30377/m.29857 type:complete len:118 (+) Transcript_30377:201-554(+)
MNNSMNSSYKASKYKTRSMNLSKKSLEIQSKCSSALGIKKISKKFENFCAYHNNPVLVDENQIESEKSNYSLFMSPPALKEFKNIKRKHALFLIRLGKKPIWMPQKFKLTKLSKLHI